MNPARRDPSHVPACTRRAYEHTLTPPSRSCRAAPSCRDVDEERPVSWGPATSETRLSEPLNEANSSRVVVFGRITNGVQVCHGLF